MLVVGLNKNQYKLVSLTVVKNILKFLVLVNIVKIKLKKILKPIKYLKYIQ